MVRQSRPTRSVAIRLRPHQTLHEGSPALTSPAASPRPSAPRDTASLPYTSHSGPSPRGPHTARPIFSQPRDEFNPGFSAHTHSGSRAPRDSLGDDAPPGHHAGARTLPLTLLPQTRLEEPVQASPLLRPLDPTLVAIPEVRRPRRGDKVPQG